jgi:hypothetical protein
MVQVQAFRLVSRQIRSLLRLRRDGEARKKANLSDSTLTRKSSQGVIRETVPQTDTGRWVEDTKAFERTLAKELGKITP